MGATEEQMATIAASGLDHVAYILILYSIAFIMFLFVNVLIHVYDRTANAVTTPLSTTNMNGHVRSAGAHSEGVQLRDAEEFELDGLMSDEDEERAAQRKLLPEESGSDDTMLDSPKPVGRNGNRVTSR
jgi:hypothetical protein